MTTFTFSSKCLLTLLGILSVSVVAFLFLLATDVAFARSSGLCSMTYNEDTEASVCDDIVVFSLAFSLINDLDAITTVILLMERADGEPVAVTAILGMLTNIFCYYLRIAVACIATSSIARRGWRPMSSVAF